MSRYFKLMMLGLLACTLHAKPPAQFTPRGIGGGGAMYSPTINPADGQEMYVACDMTPQFHTTDGGKHWATLDFRQFVGSHESAVRFTKDPNIRWAINYSAQSGGDWARPCRSTDGGKTWPVPAPAVWPTDRKTYMLYADYDNPLRALLAADYRDLYLTQDGGKTYDKVFSSTNRGAGLHLAGVFFDGDTIYAGTNDGLYVSQDGGKTFAADTAAGLPKEFMSALAGAKTAGKVRLFAVLHKGGWAGLTGAEFRDYTGLYMLDVGGAGWVRTGSDLAKTALPFFVKMATDDITTAYVAGGRNYPETGPCVYKTSDGGKTWTDVFQTSGNKNIAAGYSGDKGDFAWSFGEYALGFDVSLRDKNRLILTDLGFTHISTDGGANWTQAYTTPLVPRKSGAVIPRGAAYSSNGMEVTSVWHVAWLDARNLWACATDIKGFRSADAGQSWSFNYTGHTLNTMYHAVQHPKGTAYAATSSVHDLYQSTYLADARIDKGKGLALYSTDRGANWKTLHDFGMPVIWLVLDPRAPKRLYAAVVNSQRGGIYVTHDLDQGEKSTWTRLPAPPRTEGHPYNITVLNDGTLVCTYSGRRAPKDFTASSGVFVSSDEGKTWTDRSAPGMHFWTKDLVLDPADKTQNTWYVGVFHAWGAAARSGKSGLYRTSDRGKNWTLWADSAIAPSGILNVESCAFDPTHPKELYFTTEYDGLWYCADVTADKPVFTAVASYGFRHPLRVQFNPHQPTEMWVTSFGNAMAVGTVGN